MSNNKNKIDQLHVKELFPSKGIEPKDAASSIAWGVRIVGGSVPPNTSARVVYCLGCNDIIWPSRDCYGCNYRGQMRYVCETCYRENGFVW